MFTLQVSQQPQIPTDQTELQAVLRVSATREEGSAPQVERCEIIIIDCSGSMAGPCRGGSGRTKIDAARGATEAVLDVLPDGVHFAVVEGTHHSRAVYPLTPGLTEANERTRAEARAAVQRLTANGGTSIGTWLGEACRLFEGHETALRHAILLTDGRNNQPEKAFDEALTECEGRFVCDARAIGDDWSAQELQKIGRVLRGSARAVEDGAGLEADFRTLIEDALNKVTPDLRIRVTTSQFGKLAALTQFHPIKADYTGHLALLDEHVVELSTGTWGKETRDFQASFEVSYEAAAADGPRLHEDLRVARVDLMVDDGMQCRPAVVVVNWTDDASPGVQDYLSSYYRAQDNMSQAVEAGLDAFERGRRAEAKELIAKAVRLAHATGNEELLDQLRSLVVIHDPATGNISLGSELDPGNRERISLSALHYGRPEGAPDAPPGKAAEDETWTCARCERVSPSWAKVCEECGRPAG